MSKFLALILCLASGVKAETVLWKANGSLTTGTGLFQRQDLSPDDPVVIRMTYRDDAIQEVTSGLSFGGRIDSDYWQNIDLKITISVGSYTWEGAVVTANRGSPFTFFTRDKVETATPESVEVKISTTDQGSFSSFPFRLGQSSASFFLNFLGANSALLGSGISADQIHPEHLSTANGRISTGLGNDLSFTIDPTSLEVLFEADEVTPPIAPPASIFTTSETVILSWQSDSRFRYRVESTPDLFSDLWTEIETRFGTDTTITRTYPRPSSTLFYRIISLERTPPE